MTSLSGTKESEWVDQRLEKLARERHKVWIALKEDFDVDEDHQWRAVQCRKLARIEEELHAIDVLTTGGLKPNAR